MILWLILTVFLLTNVQEVTLESKEYVENETIPTYKYFCNDNTHSIWDTFRECNSDTNEVLIIPTYCIAYYPSMNTTSVPLYGGKCPSISIMNDNNSLGFVLPEKITDVSTFNEQVMCKQVNRTGVLCGQCNDSFGISLNSLSFECIPDEHCHGYNWLFFIMAHLAPVTVLFILVIFFKIKLTSGYAYSYILFSQIISLHSIGQSTTIGLSYVVQPSVAKLIFWPIVSFYNIWNLDMGQIFVPKMCVGGHNINTLDAIALQYIPPYYSLLLCLLVYCLSYFRKYNNNFILVQIWKSFCCGTTEQRANLSSSFINVFAIFFLLSYSKLLGTSLLLLSPTYLYDISGKRFRTVYLYDGTVNYFGNAKVILLNLFAIFTLIVFIILPSFLLLFYPTRRFRRVLEYLKLDRPGLVTFVSSFQECYKDGTNGTRDCRWFSAVYFLLRIINYTVYIILSSILQYFDTILLIQAATILVLLLIVFLSPYKQHYYNKLDISLFGLIIFILSLSLVDYFLEMADRHPITIEVLLMISFIIPFIGAVLYIGYHTVMKLIVCTRLSVKAWYNMRRVQNRSDDIDSFVQDKATVSQDLTTDHTDSTPSLPDRLIRPSSYKDEEDTFVHMSYGSTDQKL